MNISMTTFPVSPGIDGMNKLALFLNGLHPVGNWHFGRGTRFDQSEVSINFDQPADMASACLGWNIHTVPAP